MLIVRRPMPSQVSQESSQALHRVSKLKETQQVVRRSKLLNATRTQVGVQVTHAEQLDSHRSGKSTILLFSWTMSLERANMVKSAKLSSLLT